MSGPLLSTSEAIPAPEWIRLMLEDPQGEFRYFYHLFSVQRLRDDIDPVRFARAITMVLRTRESTRAKLERSNSGEWFIRDTGVELPEVKVEHLDAGSFEEVQRDVLRPYSVADDSFVRVRVAMIGSESWYFHCRHHAFWDNLSELIMIDDAIHSYRDPGWTPPSDGYFKWAKDESVADVGHRGEEGRRFWSDRVARFAGWPHSPRFDRDGSVVRSGESNTLCFDLPWSGETLLKVAAALGTTLNTIVNGAFLRALAADHGTDRAVAGWTCHGRSSRVWNIGGALLRDYDVGVEVGGDARTFLGRVRADMNAAMRHPHGFSRGLFWTVDGAEDLASVNIRDDWSRPDIFAPDPRASFKDGPDDCCELFELVLLAKNGVLTSGFVYHQTEYYSDGRVADFLRKFFDELSVFILEANVQGGGCGK